jgi:hypothetical protein
MRHRAGHRELLVEPSVAAHALQLLNLRPVGTKAGLMQQA